MSLNLRFEGSGEQRAPLLVPVALGASAPRPPQRWGKQICSTLARPLGGKLRLAQ